MRSLRRISRRQRRANVLVRSNAREFPGSEMPVAANCPTMLRTRMSEHGPGCGRAAWLNPGWRGAEALPVQPSSFPAGP